MILRVVVLLGWGIWMLVYWKGGLTTLQDIRAAASMTDRLLLIVLSIFTIILLILMTAVLVGWLPAANEIGLLFPGAVLALAGMAGTFYCRARLGRYWTAENAVQPDHHIIDSGPYGIVRHPIYTFALLLYIGSTITFLNGWTLLCGGLIAVAYILKTRHEDHFLREALSGYSSYCDRVKNRLLPGVW